MAVTLNVSGSISTMPGALPRSIALPSLRGGGGLNPRCVPAVRAGGFPPAFRPIDDGIIYGLLQLLVNAETERAGSCDPALRKYSMDAELLLKSLPSGPRVCSPTGASWEEDIIKLLPYFRSRYIYSKFLVNLFAIN